MSLGANVATNFPPNIARNDDMISVNSKSTRERARAVIGLAHPRFRGELTAEAKRLGYL